MNTIDLSNSFVACIRNGERLLEDAQLLCDFDRAPSAYALSMLSQEEFAKAFLINLTGEGVIPWSREVRKAMQDHICKQLLVLVMEFLIPSLNDFIAKIKSNSSNCIFPPHIADAMNIFRYEKLERWKSSKWVWVEPPEYDTAAKYVANGNHDKKKQNALYVRLATTGGVADIPSSITIEMAESELEKTKRLHQLVTTIKEKTVSTYGDFEAIKHAFNLLFQND